MLGSSVNIPPAQKRLIKEKIIELVSQGQSRATAAQMVNVSLRMVAYWAQKDKAWADRLWNCERHVHRIIAEAKLWEKVVAGNVTAILAWLNNNYPEKYKYGCREEKEPTGGPMMVIRTPLRGPAIVKESAGG